MTRSRDPIQLSPHWHVDCRIEAELPEDTIIGRRFIVHVVFTAVTLAAVLLVGYYGFVVLNLGHEVRDWEKRINDNRAEVDDIMRMQREYAAESVKIDQAFALVQPNLYISGFISNIGRTRPDRMAIDMIDWTDAGIILRGTLRERSDRATEMLGGYVETLRRDPGIGPLFKDIVLTDLDRGATGNMLRFEIKFSAKGKSS